MTKVLILTFKQIQNGDAKNQNKRKFNIEYKIRVFMPKIWGVRKMRYQGTNQGTKGTIVN